MKQTAENVKGITLYKCNPKLNTECDKRFCVHNENAIEHLCECTTKKEFAMKIGRTPEVKDYTPPV